VEQIKCSETSAFNNQTPGKYPKDYTQYSKHGESFKSSFLIAQHVSSDTALIIRSSKTVIAASGFTYCNEEILLTLYNVILKYISLLKYVKPEATITVFELLMMSGVSTTRSRLVGYFYTFS